MGRPTVDMREQAREQARDIMAACAPDGSHQTRSKKQFAVGGEAGRQASARAAAARRAGAGPPRGRPAASVEGPGASSRAMSAQPLSKRHNLSKDREWLAARPPRLPDLRTLTCPLCPYLAPSPAALAQRSCSARVDAVVVSAIMYAYGDKKDQLPEALKLMKAIVERKAGMNDQGGHGVVVQRGAVYPFAALRDLQAPPQGRPRKQLPDMFK
jgi:hypothetical protein